MRFVAGAAAILAAAAVRADAVDEASSSASSVIESSTSTSVPKPTFTVSFALSRHPVFVVIGVPDLTAPAHEPQGTFPRAVHR